MNEKSLNELYSLYEKKQISRNLFEGLIYKYFVKNRVKTICKNWKVQEYEDFLPWFYPRLSKSIDSYREKGSSFETFMGSVLRITAKEYRARLIRNSIIEYSAWSVHVPEMYAHEDTPSYNCENNDYIDFNDLPEKIGRNNPKQLLALILKCYYYVSDDFLEKIAKRTGIEKTVIKKMVEDMKRIKSEREDLMYNVRERVYCQYYRCMVYEKRLTLLSENTISYNKLKRKLDIARKRLNKMRARASKICADATNREIAKVIGVSKGSVDSSLYSLKTKWKALSDKSALN